MLKRLELIGFKSFADKTPFEFGPGLTAVVGPNGSGKSNVADAIRWVLGEQSARSLRGGEMAEVIFGGTAQRKALALAEVNLTLDNTRRQFAFEAAEIRLTRRVYRDGQGEYLLNGQPARLRDLREVLLGSGAGSESSFLIEQGRVDALLQASHQERREALEEAAGISRFRSRRNEAERKLEQVELNLTRLEDVFTELRRQLAAVRQQASRARKYQEFEARLKELRLSSARQRGLELRRKQTETTELLAQACQGRGEQQRLLTVLEHASVARDQSLEACRDRLREAEQQVARLEGQMARLQDQQRLSAAQETIVARRRAEAEERAITYQQRHQALAEELTVAAAATRQAEQVHDQAVAAESAAVQTSAVAELELCRVRALRDEIHRRLLEQLREPSSPSRPDREQRSLADGLKELTEKLVDGADLCEWLISCESSIPGQARPPLEELPAWASWLRQKSGQCSEWHAGLVSATPENTGHAEPMTEEPSALASVESEVTRAESAVQSAQARLMACKIDAVRAVEGLRACLAHQSRLHVELEKAAEELATLERSRSVDSIPLEQHISDSLALANELAVLSAKRSEAELHCRRVAAELETMRAEHQAEGEKYRAARAGLEHAQSEVHRLELKQREAQLHWETLAARVRDEDDVELAAILADTTLPEQTPADDGTELAELRQKLTRLGQVNMNAPAELAELEAREAELQRQHQDLLAAKMELLNLLGRMKAEAARLFTATFDKVREHFQAIFRKLFGGGMAELTLDDPDNVLESGIEITARPPGKEPRHLNLLSGGEKSLTAVALLLALFRHRPSPFCVLDEVDAALDEANVGRFAAVLREFLEHSQFIVITHSKKTMAAADTLCGITMQEPGVSKRIAIQFEPVECRVAA